MPTTGILASVPPAFSFLNFFATDRCIKAFQHQAMSSSFWFVAVCGSQ